MADNFTTWVMSAFLLLLDAEHAAIALPAYGPAPIFTGETCARLPKIKGGY